MEGETPRRRDEGRDTGQRLGEVTAGDKLGLPTPHVFDTLRTILIYRWPPYSSYINGNRT